MKTAYLIIAHKGPAQVARLLRALAHPEVVCFIHLDRKTDAAPFAFIREMPQVQFCHTRHHVTWGGYSQTQVALDCMREILSHPAGYDCINVLSGQGYPLQPASYIQDFLSRHQGKSFIQTESADSVWWQKNAQRVERYHLTEFPFPGRYAVQKLLNAVLPRRRFPSFERLYGGPMSGWYTLSRAAAKYVVDYVAANARLRRFARFTWGSDEVVIPTVLLNSPLASSIINDNLRYIDWSAGGPNPRILTQADAPKLLNSSCLWARKFDIEVDSTILDQLDQAIQHRMALPFHGVGRETV